MEIAVYDNRNGTGYNFYEETNGVTKSHEMEIRKIAPNVSESGVNLNKPTSICTRFSEMNSGKEWILSHIFHNFSREQERKHHAIVSYILNEEEADRLFEYSYEEFSALARFSQGLIDRSSKHSLQDVAKAFFYGLKNPIPDVGRFAPQEETEKLSLYEGAVCDSEERQMYMIDVNAEEDMTWLLGSLPPLLRKRVSFCVNAVDVNETMNISLIFCTEINWKKMLQQGGKQVEKIDFRTLKPINFGKSFKDESALQYATVCADILAVDDWRTYFSYAEALATRNKTEIERVIGRQEIDDILRSGDRREAVDFLAKMFGGRKSSKYAPKKEDHRPYNDDNSYQASKNNEPDDEDWEEYEKEFSFSPSHWPVWIQKAFYGVIAVLLAVCLFKLFPLQMTDENVVYYISVGVAPSKSAGNTEGTQMEGGSDVDNTQAGGDSDAIDDADAGNSNQGQGVNHDQSDASDNEENLSENAGASVAAPIRTVQIDENSVSVWIDGVPVAASVHTLQIDGNSVSVWLKGALIASLFWALIFFIRKFLTCS